MVAIARHPLLASALVTPRSFPMTRPALLAALALAFAAPAFADEKVGESPYYPTKVGTTWNYRLGEMKATVKVVKHEMKGGHMCALVETTINGNPAASG